MGNSVEHGPDRREVPASKKGGSLTSPPRTPSPDALPPGVRGQPEGNQQDGGKGSCNTRRSESGTHPPMCVSHTGTSPDTPLEVEHDPGVVRHIAVNGTFRALRSPWIHGVHRVHPGPGARGPSGAPQPSPRFRWNPDREPGPAPIDADAALGDGGGGPLQQRLTVNQGVHKAAVAGEALPVVGPDGLPDAADDLLLLRGQGLELGLGPRAGPEPQDLPGPLLPEVVAEPSRPRGPGGLVRATPPRAARAPPPTRAAPSRCPGRDRRRRRSPGPPPGPGGACGGSSGCVPGHGRHSGGTGTAAGKGPAPPAPRPSPARWEAIDDWGDRGHNRARAADGTGPRRKIRGGGRAPGPAPGTGPWRRCGRSGWWAGFLDTIGPTVPGGGLDPRARVAKLADARDLKSRGGSPSMWVRFPPRALFESRSPQAAQKIEGRFPSLAGDLWKPRVGPPRDG